MLDPLMLEVPAEKTTGYNFHDFFLQNLDYQEYFASCNLAKSKY